MAVGFEAGFDLSGLEKSIQKAQDSLDKLITKGNSVEHSIIQNFKNMQQLGVNPFVQAVNTATEALSQLGNVEIFNSKNLSDTLDDVVEIAEAIDKISNDNKPISNSTIYKLNEEIETSKQRLYELQEFLNYYVTGEGKNAIAFADTESQQKEADALMNKIEILEQEKEKQIELARIKLTLAQQEDEVQNKRNAQWKAMLDEYWRNQNETAKRTSLMWQQSYQETYDAYERMFDKIEGKEHRRRTSRSIFNEGTILYNAINEEAGYKSLDNMRRSISQMRDAQGRLNLKTEEGKNAYKELDNMIKQVQQDINSVTGAQDKFTTSIKSTNQKQREVGKSMSMTERAALNLRRTVSTIFSIRAIAGYAQSLAKVRGEFELQHKALTALIQDQDKANELWNKTVALAVRSPYRVKELVTYTKQLSAYRVESDKLYDTTKMLADIASGLGVDMQRLILAYGQVKAANYLRGTELRQFSEAGINILGELSTYFTEIEGRAVSLGEVFERVTKRMVSFQDVDAVLKRVTSQGGQFYRMQDIQAQTLQGMMSNLKDSIDIMLNDIGKANEDAMKGVIRLARTAIENWREFITVIELAAASIATLGVVSIARLSKGWKIAAAGHKKLAENIGGLTKIGAGLRSEFRRLWKTIAAHPFIAVGAAIGAVTLALVNHYKAVKAANKAYDEASAFEIRRMDNFEELTRKIEENNAAVKDAKDDQEKLANANKNLEENVKKLTEEYPDLTAFIKRNEDGTIDLTRAIEEQNEALRANIALQQQAKGSFWQQALSKNYSQALSAQGQVFSKTDTAKVAGNMMGVELQKALDEGIITKDVYERFDEAFKKIRQSKNYEEVVENWNAINKMLTETPSVPVENIFDKYAPDVQSLENAMTVYRKRLNDLFDNLDNQMDTYKISIEDILAGEGDEEQKEKAVGVWLKEQFSKLGIIDTEIQNEAARYISKQIGISPITLFDRDPSPAELDAWQKRVSEAVGKVNEKIKQKHSAMDEKELANMLIPTPQPGQMREQYMELVKEWLKVAQATYTKGQKVVEDSIVKQTAISAPFVSEVKDIFNIQETESKGKKTFNEYVDDLVRGIVDARKEYVKWNEVVGATESQARATRAFEELVAESAKYANMSDIVLANIDLSDENNVISVLQGILRRLPQDAKDARIAVQKMISDIQGDSDFMSAEGMTAKMIQGIENMFGQYELSLELEKLDFPPSLARDLFGIDSVDLSDIRAEIQRELDAAIAAGGDKERIEKLEEQLAKVDEMEQKAQMERLKTYSKYLLEEQHERVKIKMEELRKIAEVEDLYRQGEYTEGQRNTISKKIQEESQRELAKETWKSFESTDMYLSLFENMENMSKSALNNMKTRLEELRNELKKAGLPASDLKEILSQIEKVEQELEERNPLGGLFKNIGAAFSYAKKMRNLEAERAKQQKSYDTNKLFYDTDSLSLAEAERELNEIAKNKGVSSSEYSIQKQLVELLRISTNEYAKNMEEAETAVSETNKEISDLNKQTHTLEDQVRLITQGLGKVNNAFLDCLDASGLLNEGVRETAEQIAGIVESSVEASVAIGKLIGSSGADANAWIDLIVSAINIVQNGISLSDGEQKKEVNRNLREVEKLQKAYDKFSDALDDVYDIQGLEHYNKVQRDTLEQAIAAQKAAAEAQLARVKKQDEDNARYQEYLDMLEELEGLEKQLDDFDKDVFSRATGGVFDNMLSAARAVTDAWFDAFVEIGDGLSGLEDNFEETFLSIVKEAVSQKIVGEYINTFKKQIAEFVSADGYVDTTGIIGVINSVKKQMPYLNEQLEQVFGPINDALNISGGDGLTGLQKGIQGITAEQSDILASHLNNIANVLMTNDEAFNPMLAQLKTIAVQTTAINEKLNATTSSEAILVRLVQS